MDEKRLRELGKIYNFETVQQRAERILNKIYEDIIKEKDIQKEEK